MLDNNVNIYYNDVAKGELTMDFLDRLKVLMNKNGDNNATLAKGSGIPYTTIDGLFKRGWENAKISTIQKVCQHYGVLIDYMVYGVDGLSDEAQDLAAKYDGLSAAGKELVNAAMDFAAKHHKGVPESILTGRTVIGPGGTRLLEIKMKDDDEFAAQHWAKEEWKELQNEIQQVVKE